MAKIRFKDVSLKYEQILSSLKKKEFKPVYLLMGDEPYYIDAVSDFIAENVLDESEKAFNQLILYGKDTDTKAIFYSAIRPPMMAKYQVIIVKEAQNLKLDSDAQNKLELYLANFLPTTILVFCFKGKVLDKRTKLYKEIEKKGIIFETVKLYDNELPGWISNYIKQKGASIEASAAAVLAEHIGNDLNRIVNELDKLFILLPENNKTITATLIEKNIGISKEYNGFELCNALFAKNVIKANRIINYFGKNPNAAPITMIISVIFSQFVQLLKYHVFKRTNKTMQSYELAAKLGIHPFFLNDYDSASAKYHPGKIVQIIELLREYDMKSKGWNNPSSTSHAELLKELVFKIMH